MLTQLIAERYKPEYELGHGGMGRVVRAHDTRLNRTVALKMLPADATRDSELRRRLSIEAFAASALNHPGIATVYDFVEQSGDVFIVYEYVEGHTLREEMTQRRFTPDEIIDAGMQLAEALAAAHRHGVIHRDLKPENIMWTADECSGARTKVLDFGLAKRVADLSPNVTAAETPTFITTPGLLVGTVSYIAPEQLEGGAADARSDIYALGLVLYEMATGVNPFLGKTASSTIANILKEQPPPISDQNSRVPAELNQIVLQCLSKDPEERYPAARELLTELRTLRSTSVASRSAPPSASPAGETSLFRRFFLLFGSSPYRRWEIGQLRLVLWSVFLAYFGSRFRAATSNQWGRTLFLIELVCVVLSLVLLMLPLYVGAFDPARVAVQVRRTAPWIRVSTLGIVVIAWIMAGSVMDSHPVLAAFLAISGASGAFGVLFFKPVVDRAAFRENPK